MRNIKRFVVILCVMATAFVGLSNVSEASAAAESPVVKEIKYNDRELEYLFTIYGKELVTIKSGNDEKAMSTQNFSRYGDYYFISQHYGSTTYISRCMCSLTDKKLVLLDYIKLAGYGHGESIEVTGYDAATKTYTIWIGATAGNDTHNWSTDVARIKYKVTSSGAKLAESKIITNLESESGSSLPSYRASISAAENSSRICINTQIGDTNGDLYFYVYGLEALSSKLDQNPNSKMTLASLGLTPISKFSIGDKDKPYDSFQSQDIRGKLANNKFLFLAGGGTKNNCTIAQFYYSGSTVSRKYDYMFMTQSAPMNDNLYKAEIEGIKIYKDEGIEYIYVSFYRSVTTTRVTTEKIIDVYRYPVKLTESLAYLP